MFTILGGVSKNMKKWIHGNLCTDQIKDTTGSQVHTTINARIATNELMNQGVDTRDVLCYSSHQELILSNIVTESDIYDNYRYISCVNWEIKKTHETHPKMLEFNIDIPETGLKKINFNIITNNDEIDDMSDNKIVYPSDNLTNDMYQNVQQKQTTHNSLYTIVDHKLQLNSDLEDPNGADGWKSTNSHKGELVIAYNNQASNNKQNPKLFYSLYIKPNCDGNSHLIYTLSTDQILVTMKYQSVPIPEDLIKLANTTDSSDSKIQINHFDIKQFVEQDNHSNNKEYNSQTPNNDKDNSEDEDANELDNS